MALLLLTSGCDRLHRPALPDQQLGQPLAPTPPRGGLQEVAPPALVQELRTQLDRHDPHITILAPADGALLPAGPWTLELQVQDWPLVDAGPLGLGPHLVVQLDGAPPQRISDAAAASHLAMAPLTPGSHRLTVYAARPWGEVVKSPGASRQIRLDRVAANPPQVPSPGSPQLLAALASPGPSREPVLIDWLLLDAPLQHLRDDDGRWRLRVSVNGDSFLVDRQTPLWLKGFHGGSNAVQLELLDGRGEPLNPPFNSLVEEVVIQPGPGAAWQRPSLTALEQAQLLGEAPLAPEARPDASQAPAPQAAEQGLDRPAPGSTDPPLAPATQPAPGLPARAKERQTDPPASVSGASSGALADGAQPVNQEPSQAAGSAENSPAPGAIEGERANPVVGLPASSAGEPARPPLPGDTGTTPSPAAPLANPPVRELLTAPASTSTEVGLDSSQPPQASAAPRGPGPGDREPAAPGISAPIPSPTAAATSAPTAALAATPAPATATGRPGKPPGLTTQDSPFPQANAAAPAPPERLSPSSSGRARDQVAADGSLIKPRPEGPLARLRQRFQP